MGKITALLDQIKKDFPAKAKKLAKKLAAQGLSEEAIGSVEQKIEPPERIKGGIPTLKKGVYRKPSPMVQARFEYAGSWNQMGRVWLGISDMEKTARKRGVRETISALREDWEGSAPSRFPPDRLSLFSVYEELDENVAFLVWPEKEGDEPEVWAYFGQGESKHKTLQRYLEWAVK